MACHRLLIPSSAVARPRFRAMGFLCQFGAALLGRWLNVFFSTASQYPFTFSPPRGIQPLRTSNHVEVSENVIHIPYLRHMALSTDAKVISLLLSELDAVPAYNCCRPQCGTDVISSSWLPSLTPSDHPEDSHSFSRREGAVPSLARCTTMDVRQIYDSILRTSQLLSQTSTDYIRGC